MRSRYKKMRDYGIDEAEEKKLYGWCLALTEDETAELLETARSLDYPAVAEMVVESLTTGRGYNSLQKQQYIPINRNDFYAHRRKTLAVFYRRMLSEGKLNNL